MDTPAGDIRDVNQAPPAQLPFDIEIPIHDVGSGVPRNGSAEVGSQEGFLIHGIPSWGDDDAVRKRIIQRVHWCQTVVLRRYPRRTCAVDGLHEGDIVKYCRAGSEAEAEPGTYHGLLVQA